MDSILSFCNLWSQSNVRQHVEDAARTPREWGEWWGEHCESLLSEPGENPLETFLVFWCPNMFKQPVCGTFLGSISPQILCFLSFKFEFLKFNSKLSLQPVYRTPFSAWINPCNWFYYKDFSILGCNYLNRFELFGFRDSY